MASMLSFDWDETKNKQNRRKHGIWFEEAKTAFDDPNGRLFDDQEHSGDSEDRFILIGYSSTERLLVVVHCLRDNDSTVRLISARKATKKERMFYEKRV
jgi:uncharacterized protein